MKKTFLSNILVQNFLALSTIQIANLILPFLTMPYLARILGVSNYGVVLMVYSIMQLLFVLNDYGFNLSATKEISRERFNIKKVNLIYSSIISIKVILLIITFFLLLFMAKLIPIVEENKEVYFLGFGMVVGQTFTPLWLFQGMERMKYVAIVNLISKLTFTVLIFIIIKESKDYILVPLLYSIGFVIAATFSLYIAYKEFGIAYSIPNLRQIRIQINNSTQYFFSRASVSIYSQGNNFVIGLLLGEFYAGIFGVAEKLYTAMTIIYTPLSDAIYPYMVQKKDLKLFKKVLIGSMIFNVIVCTFTFLMASQIVIFVFGSGYEESSILLRLYCLLAVLLVPTTFIGYPLLGAFGYEKYANYSVVIASIIHIIILLIISTFLSVYIMIILLIVTQTIVFIIRMYGVRSLVKKGIIKFKL
ncbi:polysaccharide transporter, PST family [Maribacter sedimenticola]|uniref:Polysaccharide transporter, PST family n=1 Tax=Maribacter sedimenticola TaxID=228956 RepID=A0ABY1SCL6_9FLAO|nr:oligosaccharide flippase family protein [Maribacter sedimenticola]SNR24545.1 polysaccharide transporter, PST family [Maribacter sedimenticola]